MSRWYPLPVFLCFECAITLLFLRPYNARIFSLAMEMIFLADGPLSSGSSREVLTVFLARGLEYMGTGQRDETEDIEVIKIPIDNIYDALTRLVEDGNYIDLKIPGLIEMAKRRI